MTADHLAALAVLLVIVSGIPLGRRACRRDPGPLRRHPADTRGACSPTCPTCTALAEESHR
ncbi:hypothetical protein [Streptomyces sp. MZ04]|uniref:hypothetical protein n=1 Tax=Streptomyces sp. MZ04 TaxID=2559236 RepID=UPI00107EB390|nr:hypothetical protein [Streptomyces sp. MZ04]TGB14406.1 hypothetical protein E2651_06160 [Streptomyces sp. MZ04]